MPHRFKLASPIQALQITTGVMAELFRALGVKPQKPKIQSLNVALCESFLYSSLGISSRMEDTRKRNASNVLQSQL